MPLAANQRPARLHAQLAEREAQVAERDVSVHAPEHPLAEVATISERARSDERSRARLRDDSERGPEA
jgi:hypothetical protein